jgi:hypothetical protein
MPDARHPFLRQAQNRLCDVMVSQSNHARLAPGTFYKVIELLIFLLERKI